MTHSVRAVDPSVYTRRRVLVATAVALPIVALRKFGTGDATSNEARSAAPTASPPVAAAAPRSAATSNDSATVPPTTALEFDHDVGPGSTGAKVGALQNRLIEIGFDPGPADSVFGPATERAVWAFEKFILDTPPGGVTGVVTAGMWARLNEPIAVRPRRAGPGSHMEILLPQQVAVVYNDDAPTLITHISSGSGENWCDVVTVDNDDGTQTEHGICGIAVTPGGVFRFERRVDGWRNSKLGRLYNPVYFNYGIAVHGASNVPNVPASHGCVRIPMHIAEYFPSLVSDGDYVYVFDGHKEPEVYGAQLPVFDYPDPDYQTATSTSAR